ncbi:MAG: cytochrome P450 [Acidimicrobiia bacterium]|nr:cytochrome P450 [Acidimicrobiia bacterium]
MMARVTKPDIDLISGDFWGANPHAAMTWMRANEPVYWDGRVWGIARYEDVKVVSKRPELFSNAGGIRPESGPVAMMIDMDDPQHLKRRKLVNKGFTPRRVKESEAAVRRACDEIIDAVATKGECDFVTDIAAWLPMIMIGDALGVAPEDRRQLLEWSDGMMKGLVGTEDGIERATEAFIGYQEFASDAIAARRRDPTDDLMSVLVHAAVDGDRLTDDELVHESLLILIGGDETTRHVISGGMYQLLVHPDQKQKLLDDPSKIPTAVEEMLRWVSPIKNMARTVTRDTELRGVTLHEGDKLLLLYPSANRDEDVFDDPFAFDVERSPNEHVAFGFGAHFCLGSSLARLELVCMFEHLLRRLPDIELADPGEPAYRPANFISGYEEMPVRFSPTEPALP